MNHISELRHGLSRFEKKIPLLAAVSGDLGAILTDEAPLGMMQNIIFSLEEVSMKKYFEFTTRTIVATAIGAAIFTLLFMYVKVPSPIPETSFQIAYGISAFFGALFGPIASFLIAFIGHFLSDTLQYGSAWMSWVIASGIASFIFGLFYKTSNIAEGELKGKDIVRFNVIQVIGNVIAWIVIAPLLDILIYSEPVNLVFVQGIVACLMNAVSTGVLGSLLLIAYSKTRTGKGSLSKES